MLTVITYTLNLPSVLFGTSLVFLIIITVLYEQRRRGFRVAGFSGPPGLPFAGNLYDIKTNAAEQYRKWSSFYGDVFQIQLGDISVLVVNTASTAKAIFSGHSKALSSRPTFFTFHKVIPSLVSHG
jgi:3-hydroxyphenylacetate 6-hydroxylase